MSRDCGELSCAKGGRKVENEVWRVAAQLFRAKRRRFAEDSAVAAPLVVGQKQTGGKDGFEKRDTPHPGSVAAPVVDREVVGVTVGTVGPEREEQVDFMIVEEASESVSAGTELHQSTVGEGPHDGRFDTQDLTRRLQLAKARFAEGIRGAAVVSLSGFPGRSTEDKAAPARCGKGGEQPTEGVAFVIGVCGDGQGPRHSSMMRRGLRTP